MTDRLCIDCKHYVYFDEHGHVCSRKKSFSPVIGEVPVYELCGYARHRWFGLCGPDGKYWEKKNGTTTLD